jgi:protein ImuB
MAGRDRCGHRSGRDGAATTEHILAILHKWGIHTLGEFAALDQEQIGLRLGPEAMEMWERAQGKTTRLLKLTQPPETFEETFEFENEIETVEPLLFMLRRFLQQLSRRLGALYLVAKDLTLRLTFTDKTNYERRFEIPEPTNDIEVLFRMLHTHLEQFKSECPIVAVSLTAQPVKPSQQQFGLFETALRDPSRLYETLGRLTALLGSERVGTPVLEETYRPDAFRMEPFSWVGGTTSVSSHSSSDATERVPPLSQPPALRRFRFSAPASVFSQANEPAHLESAQVGGAVRDRKGPYHLSGNWWDNKAWEQAEWDLELEGGAVCRCHRSAEAWEVDGIYD